MSNTTAKKEKMHISVLITVIVAALIVVGAFGWAIWRNSDAAINGTVALTVGENSVSKAEFSYYYNTQVNYFINTYEKSGLLSYLGIDKTKSLSSQTCTFDSSKTWADYFAESAVSKIEQTYVLYSESIKAGFTPDNEEIQTTLDQYKTAFEAYAKTSKVNLDTYLSAAYGKGITWDRFKTFFEKSLIATQYGNKISDGIEASEDEITKYFNDNKSTYYSVDYRSVTFTYTAKDEASKTEAKKKADEFAAKAVDEATFKTLAWDLLTDEKKAEYEKAGTTDYSLTSGSTASTLPGDASTWFMADGRKTGDTTVIDNSSSSNYTVYFYVKCALKDYKLANVRVLFLSSTGDTAADTIKAATDKWNASGKTEADLEALVKEYNSAASNGGLVENITKGYTADAVNDWIFTDGRKAGDSAVVEDTTSDSKGTYILYYVSDGDVFWHYAAESQVKGTKYNEKYAELKKGYETVKKDDVIKSVY